MTYHSGIKPGLERTQHLLATVDDPHLRVPVIHIAGTNGKGSTSAMLSSILQQAGYNVGLYTSPHISRFNERIRINGQMITDEDIARMARPLMDEAKNVDGTFFEITTAMAFQYFAEKRVDVAVIEAGLGGRLDSTNVVSPIASIITSIDYDHMEYLGDTLLKIAAEKAGIIKEGAPAIVGSVSSAETEEERTALREVFEKKTAAMHTSVTFAEDVVKVDVDAIHPDMTMSISVINGDFLHYYETDLAGRHQAQNIGTVIAALPALRDVIFIDEAHVRDGLRLVRSNTGFSGRVQMVASSPTVILDVSHNPAGIQALHDTLRDAGYSNHSWHVVFGAMRDKDIMGMLSELQPLTSSLHLCTPNIERAARIPALQHLADRVGFKRISTHESVAEAVQRARMRGPTLICGSFHVADEAVAYLNG